jgi:uncharacterized protein (TIGR02266 family)
MSSPSPRRLERILAIVGATRHRSLSARLLPLGYEALLVADCSEAASALERSERPVRAGIVESRFATHAAAELQALREGGAPPFVLIGPPAGDAERAALRAAGLQLVLWEPFEDNDLRWALSRATGGEPDELRGEPRLPTSLGVRCRSGTGVKAGVLYNLSSGGAYVETPRPTPIGGHVEIEIALPSGIARARAHVVSTNVPGNLQRAQLPLGMGVRFDDVDDDSRARLEAYLRERSESLEL